MDVLFFENLVKMDDLGVPLFSETPKYLSAPCLDSYHRIHRPTLKNAGFPISNQKTVVAQD